MILYVFPQFIVHALWECLTNSDVINLLTVSSDAGDAVPTNLQPSPYPVRE